MKEEVKGQRVESRKGRRKNESQRRRGAKNTPTLKLRCTKEKEGEE